jgi:hypothetical protein
MKKFLGITSVAILMLSVLAANHLNSAPPVNRKAAGDYSNGYRGYARQAPSVNQRIAQHEADGVGHNIKAAKTQYAEIRKVSSDKETLAALDAIEKHLADAMKAHAQMDEMCKMEMVDGAGTMKCCDDIDAALEKALAEHEKLMAKIGAEK